MQQPIGTASDETATLISSDKVEGTTVYGTDGTRLGSVHNVMINKMSGQVSYVVISFGGFLGIGSDYSAVPWNKLKYNTTLGGYEIDVSREILEGAPHYAADYEPWLDPGYGPAIDEYYLR